MKKATPVSESSPQVPLHDTSRKAQRARLLARLQKGPVDTFTIARELNICRSGARITDLQKEGLRCALSELLEQLCGKFAEHVEALQDHQQAGGEA